MASLALAFDILARDRASKTFDKVGRSADDAGRKGKGFGSAVKAGLGIAAGAFAAAGIGELIKDIAGKMGEAVKAGSDLQQSLGGAEAVFKKSFGAIDKAAQGAANNLGLSRNEYLELSTVLGAGLKNKGIKDYAKQTQNLVGIGADLAAQYGGSTKDAVDALASAMRGESDPIERYGVALNETAINAELAAQGVKKGKAGYTEQQKTMARLAIITRQTADAQGAFGRESDTLAGKQQRLGANIENIKAKIGTALLPILTKVSGWFLDKGLPAVEKFGSWISGRLWPALQQGYRTILPGLKQALDIVKGGVGDNSVSWKAIGEVITTKVIPVLANIARVYLPMVATQWRIIIEVVKGVWKVFQTLMSIVGNVVKFLLRRFADLSNMWAGVLDALSHVPGFGWAKSAADKLHTAAGKADDLARAIDNIQKKVVIDVGFKPVQGRIKVGNQSLNIGLRAKGGPVEAGKVYAVGDNPDGTWNKTTELLVPSTSGRIVNQKQLAAMGSGPAAGGKTDLSESSLQRLAAILSGMRLGSPVLSVGSADLALGASLR